MNAHDPVLLPTCMNVLSPKRGESVLDATLGLGGHAGALLDAVGSEGFLVGLDADEENLRLARERLHSSQNYLCIHANFSQLPECLPSERREFDILFADLGLSSPHLDSAERGFSFRTDAPLDMRFDRSKGMSAAMLLSSVDRNRLRDILSEFGELQKAHILADAIVAQRSVKLILRSTELVELVLSSYKRDGTKLLPQVFQALRIAVNDEMGSLSTLLSQGAQLLKAGGRFGIISYHSLEDRMVKQAFKALTDTEKDPVTGRDIAPAAFEILTRKALVPSEEEVSQNPRSRSAKFRAIRRNSMYNSLRS